MSSDVNPFNTDEINRWFREENQRLQAPVDYDNEIARAYREVGVGVPLIKKEHLFYEALFHLLYKRFIITEEEYNELSKEIKNNASIDYITKMLKVFAKGDKL